MTVSHVEAGNIQEREEPQPIPNREAFVNGNCRRSVASKTIVQKMGRPAPLRIANRDHALRRGCGPRLGAAGECGRCERERPTSTIPDGAVGCWRADVASRFDGRSRRSWAARESPPLLQDRLRRGELQE